MFPNSIAAFGLKNRGVSRDQYAADFQAQTNNLNTMLQMQRSLAYTAADVPVMSGAFVPVPFDTKTYDIADAPGIHSTTVNSTRFTAINSGWYLATAQIAFEASSAGTFREVIVYNNGSATVNPQFLVVVHPAKAQILVFQITAHLHLTATDYVEYVVRQDSGGPLNVLAGLSWGAFTLASRL